MAYTGRCLYCGSEDVEIFSDGSHECMECGMTWGGTQCVQQPTYRRTYSKKGKSKEWEKSMRPYREKWRNEKKKISTNHLNIKSDGKKLNNAKTQVTKESAFTTIAYLIFAVSVYGVIGLMLYGSCSN